MCESSSPPKSPSQRSMSSSSWSKVPTTKPSSSTLVDSITTWLVSCWSSWGRLLFCAAGICISYVYYGILQERLFTDPSERLGASFVLVTSCITNTLVALLWNAISTNSSSSNNKSSSNDSSSSSTTTITTSTKQGLDHGLLIATAGCYVGAMVCSNEAVPYVSYPVAVLGKSCKLIPLMLVGQFIEHKLYSRTQWMAALLISAGIVAFQWSRMTVHPSSTSTSSTTSTDQVYGLCLLLVSLVLDGVLSSCQNLLKNNPLKRTPNAVETMLFVNLYALLFLLPWTWFNEQLQQGWEQCGWSLSSSSNHDEKDDTTPPQWYKLVLINGAVACGQIFIFLTVVWYNSIVTTTITTTRKFVTILVSVQTFGHAFTHLQWMAIGTVFTGLYLAILAQQQQQQPAQGKPTDPHKRQGSEARHASPKDMERPKQE